MLTLGYEKLFVNLHNINKFSFIEDSQNDT